MVTLRSRVAPCSFTVPFNVGTQKPNTAFGGEVGSLTLPFGLESALFLVLTPTRVGQSQPLFATPDRVTLRERTQVVTSSYPSFPC